MSGVAHGTTDAMSRHRRDGGELCAVCEQAHAYLAASRRSAALDESWRRLLDLIAGECRRAGMLP